MPRSQGFARGDLDTAFPLDDKFLDLRGRLAPERYYAGVGVYWTVVAAVWREAERKVAIRVVPDAADLVDELIAVGLLDPDGRVPSRAFTNHIGRARRQRKLSADRQARNRAGKSREVTRDNAVTSRESAPLRSVGTEGTDGTETGGAGGPDAAEALYSRTGSFPSRKVLAWIDDLAKEAGGGDAVAGEARLVEIIDRTPMGGANLRDYITGIAEAIRREDHEAEKRESVAEAARVAEKRRPVRLVEPDAGVSPEEAQRLADEWEAEYGRHAS